MMMYNNSSDATATNSTLVGARSAVSLVRPVVMLILGVFGSTGNSVILSFAVKMKTSASHVHRVSQLFIGCLTTADLLFSLCGPCVVGANGLVGTWNFGTTVCRIHQYVTVVAGYCSIGTLMLISLERYCFIILLKRNRPL